ncbi:MAG TPA: chemotaxis protein CheB [Rhizomicrobium sp.]|jgi:two-component system chemotaxis response regulator CheB
MAMRVAVAGGSEDERRALCALLSTAPAIEASMFGAAVSSAALMRFEPALVALVMGNAPDDAVEASRRIMGETPKPVVLIATESLKNADEFLARSGALAILELPSDAPSQRRFVATLEAMAEVKVVRRWGRENARLRATLPPSPRGSGQLVAIASSTGGPGALQQIFSELPANFAAPILVVQHIAGGFAESLVRSLNGTQLAVKLAEEGEMLKPGTVYIAPDNRHLGISSRNTVALSETPAIEGFRPSATFLFEAAAKAFGRQLTAVVLTGMGRDGVAGLRAVHEGGGTIIAQDRETSTVFGMPKAAIESGFVDRVLPLGAIARELAAPAPVQGVML